MELFGRELSLEQMIGLVECHATPDEDLVHRAALEIIAALRESQRRAEAAVEDMETFKVHSQAIGKLSSCNDCMLAKDCVVKPGIGEWVRINCHLWRGFSEKEG